MSSRPKTSIEEWVFALLGFGSCFFTIVVPMAMLLFLCWVAVKFMQFYGVT